MIPNVDFSNINKLILGCVAKIDCFDTYFKQMPKLEYFGYVFYTHYMKDENQQQLNPTAWDIADNYTIKHLEVTVSEYDIGYSYIIN